MDACQGGGFDDLARVGFPEAGDVLGHRAVEQLDVLWQVAKVRPQGFAGPLAYLGAVQAHRSIAGRPDADHGAGQGRLAGSTRADDGQHLAFGQGQVDAIHRWTLAPRRGDHQAFDTNGSGRVRQGHTFKLTWEFVEQQAQALVAGFGVIQLLP